MGERRFAIAEIRNCHSQIPEITESELKRRFSRAAEKYRLYDHPWESVLEVLIYGECENGEEKQLWKNQLEGSWEVEKPTHTREEWQKWAYSMPYPLSDVSLKEAWNWILSMPIVPKEIK